MPNWQNLEDIQLISIAQNGEAEAFGELYERYAESIFRFLYVRLSNRLDAEDLTAEVFMRVYRSLSGYREQGTPFLAYLFRIARNALIDHYRSSSRSGEKVSIDDSIIQDLHPDAGEAAMTSLEHQEVREVLDQLRDDYRTVLVLRFLSELTPDETAQVMGRSPGAIRVLQHRALTALRNLIEGV